jgi:hypothetical protein
MHTNKTVSKGTERQKVPVERMKARIKITIYGTAGN